MNEPACFEIPGDVLVLSPNRRLHPMERARLVKDWKARAWYAWMAAGCPKFDVPVRIAATLRRVRAVDPDNAAAALKACWDGLCTNRWHIERLRDAMLPGDSAKWVEYAPVQQETGQHWKGKESVIVRVEPISGTDCANMPSL
jgi:hypothetical protein